MKVAALQMMSRPEVQANLDDAAQLIAQAAAEAPHLPIAITANSISAAGGCWAETLSIAEPSACSISPSMKVEYRNIAPVRSTLPRISSPAFWNSAWRCCRANE
jgi:hypothetical protein